MKTRATRMSFGALLALAAITGAGAAQAATVTVTTPAPVIETPPSTVVVEPGAPVVHGFPGHPRAAAIDRRIANLEIQIDTNMRAGQLRMGQARALHRQLAVVRHNERVYMLKRYISPPEFHQLQHQLDAVAYNIRAMRHNNQLPG